MPRKRTGPRPERGQGFGDLWCFYRKKGQAKQITMELGSRASRGQHEMGSSSNWLPAPNELHEAGVSWDVTRECSSGTPPFLTCTS